MPRVKRKTKSENLERVRNNQRKCRQRRRDYVAELESRIISCQEAAIQENAKFQAKEEKLLMENQALRTLLDISGVDTNVVEQFLAKKLQEGTSKESQLSPVVTNPASFNVELGADPTTSQLSNKTVSEFLESSTTVMDVTGPLPLLGPQLLPSPHTTLGDSFGLPMSDIYTSDLYERALEHHPFDFLSATNQNLPGSIFGRGTDDVFQDTTLCTIAIQIVGLCNKKNIDILELDSKLRPGYRNVSAPLEGCRVDNRVLLSVLAEIIC